MFPNKGIPGGWGIGVVIAMSGCSIDVGDGDFVEEEMSIAEEKVGRGRSVH